MALTPEVIAERRRLGRRLVFWRSAAALAVALAVVAWFRVAGIVSPWGETGDRVAVLDISGVIIQDRARLDAIKAAGADDRVQALIINIDSPGGTFVGSDDLYRSLRDVAEMKPVVAVINNVAASGGYMAALASERIFARRASITGSVGVLFQAPRVNRLLDNVGVDVDVWRSGALKARPSPLEAPTVAVDAHAQEMVQHLFVMFIDMVKERRSLTPDVVARISDGRVVIGAEAVKLGLIDAIGEISAARDWLATEHDVSDDLPEVDVTPAAAEERQGLLGQALAFALGRDQADAMLAPSGLLVLWRPLASAAQVR